jgi:hypothetical protein
MPRALFTALASSVKICDKNTKGRANFREAQGGIDYARSRLGIIR